MFAFAFFLSNLSGIRVATQLAEQRAFARDSFHNLTVLSVLPVARKLPVGSNATETTEVSGPLLSSEKLCTRVADNVLADFDIFHNMAVLL
jgi:hypothetical protein